MECKKCNSPLEDYLRNCEVCQFDNGFPNVRIALKVEEFSALTKRHDEASTHTEARNCREILESFEREISRSNAVICKDLSVVWNLVSSDNIVYKSFNKQVGSGLKLPSGSYWDFARPIVEATIFPYYADEIIYAALSINDRGLYNYGDYHIILNEDYIRDRASVFEENSILFCKKHKIIVGDKIRPGYRSTWEERAKLAGAKLHSKLDDKSKLSDYPQILLSPGKTSEDDNFLEVHIYGGIHRRAIKKVIGPEPKKGERALKQSVEKKLKEVGATFEILT